MPGLILTTIVAPPSRISGRALAVAGLSAYGRLTYSYSKSGSKIERQTQPE
jgi:hypothetical protein